MSFSKKINFFIILLFFYTSSSFSQETSELKWKDHIYNYSNKLNITADINPREIDSYCLKYLTPEGRFYRRAENECMKINREKLKKIKLEEYEKIEKKFIDTQIQKFQSKSKLPRCVGKDKITFNNCVGIASYNGLTLGHYEYVGDFKNGLPDGNGIAYSSYDLPGRDNLPPGRDSVFEYEGQWKAGLFHGNGKHYLKVRGTTYTGVFKNGLPYGNGTWEDGNKVDVILKK